MKKSLWVLLWCLACGSLFALPEAPDPSGNRKQLNDHGNTQIRVLIDKASDAVHLGTFSTRLSVQVENYASPFLLGKDLSISLSSDQTRFLIRNKTIPMKWLAIRSSDGVSPLSYQGHIYRGALWLRIQQGKILVINALPLETYLLGTLGSEMNPSWEFEALKAQAVASRTYALSRIEQPKSEFYDLEKTIQDQVYEGVQAENPRVKEAVFETTGQVLTQNDHIIRSYYHSRCGGTTESPTTVWNGKERTSRVECPFCKKNPYFWKASFTLEEVRKALGVDGVGRFRLASLEKSNSGRVTRLTAHDDEYEKTVTSDQLRNLLGYQKLKSALFHWKIGENNITFEGLGSGHGVGMCQWGARYLAKTGKTYREILSHYYPGTRLKRTSS